MLEDVSIVDKLVGLNCWITDFPAIKGKIRERYEDFIVEEILPDGTVLELKKPKLKPSGLEGLFTHFILIKKGISNFDAIITIADKLHVPLSYFFYSGNKDKDAVTVQRVAVWGVPPEKLMTLNLPANINIASPIRELRRIHIGEHKGNRFTILIRDIGYENKSVLEELLHVLRKAKLPNYFGYQRFGIVRPITHIVGKLFVMRRYRDAILTYIAAPSLIDDDELLNAKGRILEGDYKSALKEIPKKVMRYESEILHNIIRLKEDWIKVTKCIPSFLLRIFIEAYQGYIFNKIISKLICENRGIVLDMDKTKMIPLVGYKMIEKTTNNSLLSIISSVLEEEKINIGLFKNKQFPPLSIKGGSRPALFSPKFSEIKLIETNNKLNLYLRFILGKGQYATIVLREILKHNIITAQLKKIGLINKESIKRNLDKLLSFLKQMNISITI